MCVCVCVCVVSVCVLCECGNAWTRSLVQTICDMCHEGFMAAHKVLNCLTSLLNNQFQSTLISTFSNSFTFISTLYQLEVGSVCDICRQVLTFNQPHPAECSLWGINLISYEQYTHMYMCVCVLVRVRLRKLPHDSVCCGAENVNLVNRE